ncbi:MAG TPA: glucose-1-phosphate cytidylyltransferase [Phototrophicaceae bacterium]|nr:glucose-1-phosphate cytidylyltransferase [Phototrophicaceae bacterium]
MKTVILAGGFGTRLAEYTELKPKPMVEVGGHPLLWHIMKHYAHFGFKEFVIALGYKGEVIKQYFLNYYSINSQVLSLSLKDGRVNLIESAAEDWLIDLVDTGLTTQTGGRIKRLQKWLGDSTFMVTYGDGVSNVDLNAVLRFHRQHGRIATVTAVRPPARFGGLTLDGEMVVNFAEKPQIGEGWINGGFLVFDPGVFDYLGDDNTVLEAHTLETLAREGQLAAYCHSDFWQCMDTLRDKNYLETIWQNGHAPWRFDS